MDYPLVSVQESLVPTAVVNVKLFEADTQEALEELINQWVADTQNLVVCPGPVSIKDDVSSVAITYVAAGKNDDPNNRRPPKMAKPPFGSTRSSGKLSAKESDGGRIA